MKEENKEKGWIDINDDDLMVKLGLRLPLLEFRGSSTKTSQERKALRSVKRMFKKKMHFHMVPQKTIPVQAKLIVYLKKNKKFPHTTYSFNCWMHQIGNIIGLFYNKEINLVDKYIYNGKTYGPNERPFWR